MSSLGLTTTPERATGGKAPNYCPHWPACKWSFSGSARQAEGFLKTHIRVVHKGDDPRPERPEEQPPRPRRAIRRATPGEAIGAPPIASPSAAPEGRVEPTTLAGRDEEGLPSEPEGSTPARTAAERSGHGDPPADPDDAALDRWPGGSPSRPVKATRCRTPGCANRANARYDRGVLSGLCWEVCVPAAREEASRRGKAARAAAAGIGSGEPPAEHLTPSEPGQGSQATRASSGDARNSPAPTREAGAGGSPGPDLSFRDLLAQAIRGRRELLELEQRYHEQLRLVKLHPDFARIAPIVGDALEL